MRNNVKLILGVLLVASAGILFVTGCGSKPGTEPAKVAGPAEKAGAALDKAVQESETAAKNAAGKAVENAGVTLEKVGAAVQRTGENLKAGEDPAKTP
jgi:hypothetical protein